MSHYVDLVVRDLATDVVDLRIANQQLSSLVESLQADVAVYREVGQAAVDALHNLTVRHDRLQATHAETVDAYQRLRETLVLQVTPDDERVPA